MKLISSLLESIEGIENWYIAGLLIFFLMFIIFVVRTLRKPRKEMEDIKNSILEDDDNDNNNH
jgi:cbb3-type cytochrome oxidase subunit 3